MREKIKDTDRIKHIEEAINNIFEFIENKTFDDYRKDKILKFAIIKNLEIIGEAAYLLTKEFRHKHSETAWDDIIAMRHVLVHGYYQIKDEIVWATIENELLPLKVKILNYLQ